MRAQASDALCEFVRKSAPLHHATPDAPSNWAMLKAWHRETPSIDSGLPNLSLPVYDGGSENTIYPDAATNYAFRAWHDSIHLANDYSFTYLDEVKVGLIHMQQARRAGLPQADLDMLIADTIGQAAYYNKHRKFVDLQDQFVFDVLRDGVNEILMRGDVY